MSSPTGRVEDAPDHAASGAGGDDYLAWAKTHAESRFNLATSGVLALPFAELGASPTDLELNGPVAYGYPPLQQALAARSGAPERCVVATIGTSQANFLAMAATLAPGDEVVIEEPGYQPLHAATAHLGARVRVFGRRAEDGFAVDPGTVRRAMTPRTRLIVVSNLHNPSGAAVGEPALRALGELARAQGARVLVDEVYLEMRRVEGERGGAAPRSAFHLGPEFLATGSLTKAYGLGGLRCGWLLAPAEVAARAWSLLDLTIGTAAHPAERLAVVALAQLDRIADRARALLAVNRPRLERFLAARSDLDVTRPPCGTVVFPRWRGGDVTPLCARLRDRYDTTVVPGRFFGAPAHFRLGIGGDSADLDEGLERLGRALDDLQRTQSP